MKIKNKLLPKFPELNSVTINPGNESYIINKKRITICTRDNDDNLYSTNMLTRVILHELAHSMSLTTGHDNNFKSIFKKLLKRAEKYGLYNSSIPVIKNYCKNNIISKNKN